MIEQERDDVIVLPEPGARRACPVVVGRPVARSVLLNRVEKVLAKTAALLRDSTIAVACADEIEADIALARATDALGHHARLASWRRGPGLIELIDTLTVAHDARAALGEVRRRRLIERSAQIHLALERLRDLPSLAHVIEHAPAVLSSCGFDRVVLTSLDDCECEVVSCHAASAEAKEAIIAALREPLAPLSYKTHEADAVRRRRPVLVDGSGGPTLTPYETMRRLASTSYVVAPVIALGRVVALAHADRVTRTLDDEDRDALGTLAVGLGETVARLETAQRLRSTSRAVQRLATDVHEEMRATMSASCQLRPPGPEDETPGPRSEAARLENVLSRREMEVLGLMADGETNRQIAARLVVAESTVKSHVKSILRKLHAANRADAVSRYLRLAARPAFA